MKKTTGILMAGLALGALSTAAAFGATPKDVLVIGKASDPQTLDPAVTIDNNDWTITYPSYQRLVQYESKNGKGLSTVTGDLAASWTESKDGLTWTFKLKPGNKFSDGSPVDANAVKFSFERLLKLKQGPAEAFPSDLKVTVVDPLTVRFTMGSAFAPFLYTLANDGASIVNPKAVTANAKGNDLGQGWLSAHTAGSGPFELSQWNKGQDLVLVPNPHYAGRKPRLSKVIVKIVPEASARRLQLEGGDLDIVDNLPLDQIKAVQKEKAIKVATYPSLLVTYLYLNNKKAPLDNRDVRQAIVDAVDVKGIVDGVMLGNAKPMAGPIPDGMWGYDPALKPARLDVKAAKALLAKAHAAGTQLTFALSDHDPNWQPIALAVQSNLADAGLKVKLETIANATYRERLGKGDFDIAIGDWSPDFADPYMFMNYWFDSAKQGLSGNRSFYSNPVVDKLVRQAMVGTDQKVRAALYDKAQRIVVKDAAYVYLFQRNRQVAERSNVKGYVFNPMLEQIYNIADMWKSN